MYQCRMHVFIKYDCWGKKAQRAFIELRPALVQIRVRALFDWIALTCTNCATKSANCLPILPKTVYLSKMVLFDDFAIQKV